MKNVSEHITYAEAIRSDAAKRAGINNYFTPNQLENMIVIAEKVYEPLVKHFDTKIYLSSFFRNKKVNELIGGVKDSQHLANNGAAMDLDADQNIGITNKEVFNYIKDHLDYDQLIIEDLKPDGGIGWVHVSYKKKGNRKQTLIMTLVDGVKKYEPYND